MRNFTAKQGAFFNFFEHFNFFAEKHHPRAFLLGEETKNVLYQIE